MTSINVFFCIPIQKLRPSNSGSTLTFITGFFYQKSDRFSVDTTSNRNDKHLIRSTTIRQSLVKALLAVATQQAILGIQRTGTKGSTKLMMNTI
jgi:hypothetical protein